MRNNDLENQTPFHIELVSHYTQYTDRQYTVFTAVLAIAFRLKMNFTYIWVKYVLIRIVPRTSDDDRASDGAVTFRFIYLTQAFLHFLSQQQSVESQGPLLICETIDTHIILDDIEPALIGFCNLRAGTTKH